VNNSNFQKFDDFFSNYFLEKQINAQKVYLELLEYFSESQNDFIIRRHAELKNEGKKNDEIYRMLSDEITDQLFRGVKLSPRQIKRIIYKE
jgi:hypothetical protein